MVQAINRYINANVQQISCSEMFLLGMQVLACYEMLPSARERLGNGDMSEEQISNKK